jgi:glycosyltransferase involved in cell wall biosynthesis
MVTGTVPPQPCGVGDYSFELATWLRRLGLDVDIYTSRVDKIETASNADGILPIVARWTPDKSPKLSRSFRTRQTDVVHVQYPTLSYGAGLLPQALVFRRRSVVVTLHEASFSHILRRISLFPFLLWANAIVATTDFEAEYLATMYPPVRKRLCVIPIGSSIPKGASDTRRELTVVYFGLVAEKKGLEQFVELATMCARANLPWKFSVIGKVPDCEGNYCRILQSREPTVEWRLGLTPVEVSAQLAVAAVAYLPFPDGASERRSSLIAVLSNGVPTITTLGTATPAALRESRTVLFADSVDEAYTQMEKLLSDETLRVGLSRDALEFAERFSWPEIAVRHAKLYEGVSRRPRLFAAMLTAIARSGSRGASRVKRTVINGEKDCAA